MLYTFWFINVPEDNDVCQWIRYKCGVLDQKLSLQTGKKSFDYRFCSTKKNWAVAMREFLISNNCAITEIVESDYKY